MTIRTAAFVLVAVVALAGACGGGGDSGGRETAGDGRDPILEEAGIGTVQLSGPDEDGAGKVPTFSWKPVDGAVEYRLFVLNAEGQPIWAWQGAATTVVLGAIPDRPEGEAGPVVTDGSTWSVAALDAIGAVIAISSDRAVSP